MNRKPQQYFLLFDIGGTNGRAAIATDHGDRSVSLLDFAKVAWPALEEGAAKRSSLLAEQTRELLFRHSATISPKDIVYVVCGAAGVIEGTIAFLDKYPDGKFDIAEVLKILELNVPTRMINDGASLAAGTFRLSKKDYMVLQGNKPTNTSMIFIPGTGVAVAIAVESPDGGIIVIPGELGNIPAPTTRIRTSIKPWDAYLREWNATLIDTGLLGRQCPDVIAEGLHLGPIIEPRMEQYSAGLGLLLLGIHAGLNPATPAEVTEYMRTPSLKNVEKVTQMRRLQSGVYGTHCRMITLAAANATLYIGGHPSAMPHVFDHKAFLEAFADDPCESHREMHRRMPVRLLTEEANAKLALSGAAFIAHALHNGLTVMI